MWTSEQHCKASEEGGWSGEWLLPLNHMSLWSLYIEKKWLQVMLKINSKQTWTWYSCGCCFTVTESWFYSPGCNTFSRTSFVTHQSLFSNFINSASAWSLKPAPFTNNEVSFMILNNQNVMTNGHGYCSQRVGEWFRRLLMCPRLGSDMVVPFSHRYASLILCLNQHSSLCRICTSSWLKE